MYMWAKVYEYVVEIPSDRNSWRKPTYEITEYDILYENEEQFVIKKYWLCVVNRKKDKYSMNYNLEEEKLYNETNELFTKGIKYRCMTMKKKRASSIKTKIERFIEKEFWFLNNIDLDFIK